MPIIPKTTKYKWIREYKPRAYSMPAIAKLYNTTRWRKLRLLFIKENPVCAMCKKNNRLTAAKLVDHIKPVSEGGSFTAWSNLQALCDKCHRIKTAKEVNKRKQLTRDINKKKNKQLGG
jgi:5-methylcytosine-specific restriction protein A